MSDHQPNREVIPGVGVQRPARKRGRPPIPVTDAIVEQRRLSRQRVNAQRSESVGGQGPARKRGRPPIIVTDEVLEQRRLSRQRVNAQRSESEGTSRSRGRPRGSRNKANLERGPLSISRPGCISTEVAISRYNVKCESNFQDTRTLLSSLPASVIFWLLRKTLSFLSSRFIALSLPILLQVSADRFGLYQEND